jgi:hypothetical protein
MNNRTADSHYPWTKKWGAIQQQSLLAIARKWISEWRLRGSHSRPGFRKSFVLQDICVEHGFHWLHDGCTAAALQGLVAAWHQLTLKVREAIIKLADEGSNGG